ncbi:efflux RND transporter periplasmic adaptor subunit [Elongatibacter sediminis]|uniref:Efflux RND transporter periplasmic adaptor subunit n=1 Tax=Elongatibacter sediminis TaxID=3119006 RepID=A0AAW9REP9_9GAMM
MSRSNFMWAGLLAAVGLLLSSCSESGAETRQAPPPPPVSVAEVVAKEVQQWDEFNGRIEAAETVEVRPRVSGYIEAVAYEEGQEVRKGDVLFVIDQRSYRAELEQAEAELAQARTEAELARTELARARKLVEAQMIAEELFDQRAAAAERGEAAIRAAEARAEVARLNLEFTEVRAPIDGRAGRALVTPGNLVSTQPNATLLTTLVSIDPIYVYFEGDEQTYLRYVKMARDGERPSSRDAHNPVRVGLANESGFPHEGYMDFVDNQLDASTGTIRARAVLDNSQRIFTPGLFARVQLLGSGSFPALLIDDKAVLTDQDRKYVYVLGPDDRAERRDVTLGRVVEGLRVITSGLQPGDRVIVHGIQRIFMPGMQVAPEPIAMGDMPHSAPRIAALERDGEDAAATVLEPGR